MVVDELETLGVGLGPSVCAVAGTVADVEGEGEPCAVGVTPHAVISPAKSAASAGKARKFTPTFFRTRTRHSSGAAVAWPAGCAQNLMIMASGRGPVF